MTPVLSSTLVLGKDLIASGHYWKLCLWGVTEPKVKDGWARWYLHLQCTWYCFPKEFYSGRCLEL